MVTDEPAVLSWMIALAPRPRPAKTGRHWWRELVTELWRDADAAWLRQREAEAIGYPAEEQDFARRHPRPTLGGFMRALSAGHLVPERVSS